MVSDIDVRHFGEINRALDEAEMMKALHLYLWHKHIECAPPTITVLPVEIGRD